MARPVRESTRVTRAASRTEGIRRCPVRDTEEIRDVLRTSSVRDPDAITEPAPLFTRRPR
jgi:hypothetical protein